MQPSPPRETPHPRRSQPFALVIAIALALVVGMVVWRSGVASSVFGDGGGPAGAATSGGPSNGSTPTAHGSSAPSATAPVPPACVYGSKPARGATYALWRSTLLDTTFRLPSGYAPPDLVPVSEAGFHSGLLVRSLVVDNLSALRAAAAAAGHPLEIVAAYRSYQYQADLFQRREERLGTDEAMRKTARPGHSEHQLGTAVDFKRAGAPTATEAFGTTATGKWLLANASSFGFLLSYPEGRDAVTCYAYEPWHFRYFGKRTAARIVASGLTTREYLWAHRPPKQAATPGPGTATAAPSGSAPSASP
jgi:D-alanyl-D-alanine carboxypeptidase